MSDSGSTSNRGLILLSVALIGSGIYVLTLAIPAIKTGELIHMLSPTYAYGGYEATGLGLLSILAGVAGFWIVLGKKKDKGPSV
jgi:hypothetical protein